MSKENYIPFGEEWKKEMSKMPKAHIIQMFANLCQKKQSPSSPPVQEDKSMEEIIAKYIGNPTATLRRDVEAAMQSYATQQTNKMREALEKIATHYMTLESAQSIANEALKQ